MTTKIDSKGTRALGRHKQANGLTYEELAEQIAECEPHLGTCSKRMATDLALGQRRPSLKMGAKIEALIGVTARDWFE